MFCMSDLGTFHAPSTVCFARAQNLDETRAAMTEQLSQQAQQLARMQAEYDTVRISAASSYCQLMRVDFEKRWRQGSETRVNSSLFARVSVPCVVC